MICLMTDFIYISSLLYNSEPVYKLQKLMLLINDKTQLIHLYDVVKICHEMV